MFLDSDQRRIDKISWQRWQTPFPTEWPFQYFETRRFGLGNFTQAECENALQASYFDPDRAAVYLFDDNNLSSSPPQKPVQMSKQWINNKSQTITKLEMMTQRPRIAVIQVLALNDDTAAADRPVFSLSIFE
jgi:hypothetical protein